MCDWADKNAPHEERYRLWKLIRETPMLDWQLLTKRAPNIPLFLPCDWNGGYDNVWLGVTVENRKHGLPRMEILKAINCMVRFLSIEPLLEDLGELNLDNIHWVIVGGESGHHARPMDPAWVRRVADQCREQNVPIFFKQWGGQQIDKGGCLLDGREVKEWPHKIGGFR
jgi:protein gp37